MQVDNTGSVTSIVQGTKEGKSSQRIQANEHQNQQQSTQQTRQTDTVTFTEAAAQLQRVEQFIKAAPVTDSQRIEQVQSAITKGNYDPDPAQTAGKMLNFEAALNGARSHS